MKKLLLLSVITLATVIYPAATTTTTVTVTKTTPTETPAPNTSNFAAGPGKINPDTTQVGSKYAQ